MDETVKGTSGALSSTREPRLVFQTDQNGVFVGVTYADPSPLEPNVWLLPAGCVETPPPSPADGYIAVWRNMMWETVAAPRGDIAVEDLGLTPEQQLESERSRMSLSFAQMLIGLVSEGWITAEEGRAWRDRVALPKQVSDIISQIPAEQQFAVETRAFAPSEVLRTDPLVAAMGTAAGKTEVEMDDFFRKYAQI